MSLPVYLRSTTAGNAGTWSRLRVPSSALEVRPFLAFLRAELDVPIEFGFKLSTSDRERGDAAGPPDEDPRLKPITTVAEFGGLFEALEWTEEDGAAALTLVVELKKKDPAAIAKANAEKEEKEKEKERARVAALNARPATVVPAQVQSSKPSRLTASSSATTNANADRKTHSQYTNSSADTSSTKAAFPRLNPTRGSATPSSDTGSASTQADPATLSISQRMAMFGGARGGAAATTTVAKPSWVRGNATNAAASTTAASSSIATPAAAPKPTTLAATAEPTIPKSNAPVSTTATAVLPDANTPSATVATPAPVASPAPNVVTPSLTVIIPQPAPTDVPAPTEVIIDAPLSISTVEVSHVKTAAAHARVGSLAKITLDSPVERATLVSPTHTVLIASPQQMMPVTHVVAADDDLPPPPVGFSDPFAPKPAEPTNTNVATTITNATIVATTPTQTTNVSTTDVTPLAAIIKPIEVASLAFALPSPPAVVVVESVPAPPAEEAPAPPSITTIEIAPMTHAVVAAAPATFTAQSMSVIEPVQPAQPPPPPPEAADEDAPPMLRVVPLTSVITVHPSLPTPPTVIEPAAAPQLRVIQPSAVITINPTQTLVVQPSLPTPPVHHAITTPPTNVSSAAITTAHPPLPSPPSAVAFPSLPTPPAAAVAITVIEPAANPPLPMPPSSVSSFVPNGLQVAQVFAVGDARCPLPPPPAGTADQAMSLPVVHTFEANSGAPPPPPSQLSDFLSNLRAHSSHLTRLYDSAAFDEMIALCESQVLAYESECATGVLPSQSLAKQQASNGILVFLFHLALARTSRGEYEAGARATARHTEQYEALPPLLQRETANVHMRAQLLHNSGVALERQGDAAGALRALKSAVEVSALDTAPGASVTRAAIFSAIGNVYTAARHFNEAAAAHDQAIALEDQRGNEAAWGIFHAAASSAAQRGAFERAVDLDSRACQLLSASGARPNARLHFNRALCYQKLSRWSDSRDDFTRVIDVDSNAHPKAYTLRAKAALQQRDWPSVVADCTAALRLTPNDQQAQQYMQFAQQQMQMGQ